ncbi:MAG: CatB-related O-acetyltransferase [Planctomycetota bacterium]
MSPNRPVPKDANPAWLTPEAEPVELRHHALAGLIRLGYRVTQGPRRSKLARFWCALAARLEGGDMRSATLRDFLSKDWYVHLGAHSYGPCSMPGYWPPSVSVGRYVSVGPNVAVYTQNHPLDRVSTHPYFYDARCGVVPAEELEPGLLRIEHDVWLGRNAVVLPGCQRIGVGAVIGAGAIVTKDVPDFAIVGGVPGKLLRYRYDEPTQQRVLASRWWEKTPEALAGELDQMLKPAEDALADLAPTADPTPDAT